MKTLKSFKETFKQAENSEQDFDTKVWRMFSDPEKCPTEDDFKVLGRALDVDDDFLENIAFRLLHSFVAFGNSGNENKIVNFEELEKGIEEEYEHTINRKIATKIAKDHLYHIPDYYTRLERMERAAEIELGLDDYEEETY